MTAAATSFKTCIVIKIIFNIVAVVKMVTDYFTIMANYEVSPVGIIASIPFFGRCHT